jgi:hypothetical protein
MKLLQQIIDQTQINEKFSVEDFTPHEYEYEDVSSTKDIANIYIKNGKFKKNFPEKMGTFDCFDFASLTSLEGCPTEVDSFNCNNTNITSLEFSPKIIDKWFVCADTKITSLDHAPLKCNAFACDGNNILHLKGIGRSYLKECEYLYLPNTIKSNILGLCRVKNLHTFYIYDKYVNYINYIRFGELFEALQIVKKYLNTDGSDCQEELIQNRYNDYAKF